MQLYGKSPPGDGAGGGRQIAEKIGAATAQQVVRRANDESQMTVSIGLAERQPDDDLPSLSACCDAALHGAKREGCDRVAAA